MPGNKLTTCLWFDGNAEEAAKHYTSIFRDSKITNTHRYPDAGYETKGITPGKVMTVEFEINGQQFVGLNGGPEFKFTPAVSIQIGCDNQEEVDYYWEKLSEGGDEKEQNCGWVSDKFGFRWQVVPRALPKLLGSGDKEKSARVMKAMMGMKKMDIAALENA